MIEHPNLYRTNPVHILSGVPSGMTRFCPIERYGTPSAQYDPDGFENPDPFTALFTTPHKARRTQRTQWVTRVPIRVGNTPRMAGPRVTDLWEVTRRDKSPGD